MTNEEFEKLLDKAVLVLGNDLRASTKYHSPSNFQQHVFDVLVNVAKGENLTISPTFHPHAFPDIRANGFGVEVKSVAKDSWLSVGNSVFEGMRDRDVKSIYVIFGKMGGMPSVRWGRYEQIITHVRISHAPRFVVEMDRNSSLFEKMGIPYDGFSQLTPEEKMRHIRQYSRERLKPGERLWWLEDENEPGTPLEVKLYMDLPQEQKRQLRAEVVLLFPQIVGNSRANRYKYVDPAFFMLKYRNVFCPQTRDLFSAGSVAGKTRGGNYLMRAIQGIENEIENAALSLDDALFEEYWGHTVPPPDRIAAWLKKADSHASDWTPSRSLFLNKRHSN